MRKILILMVLLLSPTLAIAGPEDDFNKGVAASQAGNAKEAVRWWRKAAEQGFAEAQYNLGGAYHVGFGVAQSDKEAVRWFRKAARQGHAEAQLFLGGAYSEGEGVAQSDKEAVRWWRKAANQGDAEAQVALGWAYRKGKGVLKNDKEAMRWYLKAANQGHAGSQAILGILYKAGLYGVAQNKVLAYKWSLLAVFRGFERAREDVDKIEKKLTPRQRNAGQEAAQKWIEKFEARQAEK